jgi:DNA-binding IclR family transcriptional regulator
MEVQPAPESGASGTALLSQLREKEEEEMTENVTNVRQYSGAELEELRKQQSNATISPLPRK